jgi:hypothetical protein
MLVSGQIEIIHINLQVIYLLITRIQIKYTRVVFCMAVRVMPCGDYTCHAMYDPRADADNVVQYFPHLHAHRHIRDTDIRRL